MSENIIIDVALTPRHGCPATQHVWPETVEDILNFKLHLDEASKWVDANVVREDGEVRNYEDDNFVSEVRLYVTGLTSLTVAFLNAWVCLEYPPVLKLMHWDRDTGDYVAQDWLWNN